MAITQFTLPVPTRADPANFAERADVLVTELTTFVTEANTLASDVNAKQTLAANSAIDSANSAIASANSASDSLDSANDSAASAVASANSAASALNSPGTSATSTTSNTIGLGTKTFTIQTGKTFSVGQRMVAANTALPLNNISGIIANHDSGTGSITIEADYSAGSGTYIVWTLSLSPSGGVLAVNGEQGFVTGIATLAGSENLLNKQLTTPVITENIQVVAVNTNAVASRRYVLIDNVIITLPATPSPGDWIGIQNSSTSVTSILARNGSNIMSLAEDLVINKLNASFTLLYADTARGWVVI